MANGNVNNELWTEEYIKGLGTQQIIDYIRFANGDISSTDYEQLKKDFESKFVPFNESNAKKFEAISIYPIMRDSLAELNYDYIGTIQLFRDTNADILYVLHLITLTETLIMGQMEYNLLLDKIPTEAKANIDKEFTTPKDVVKSIKTMASIEFAVNSEKTDKPTTKILNDPTFFYCRLEAIKLIMNCIYEQYGIIDKIQLREAYKEDIFLNVCKLIDQLKTNGNDRSKGFENTLFYRKFEHYKNINKVVQQEDYKKTEQLAKEYIREYLEKSQDMKNLLNDTVNILYKQGWWLVNE